MLPGAHATHGGSPAGREGRRARFALAGDAFCRSVVAPLVVQQQAAAPISPVAFRAEGVDHNPVLCALEECMRQRYRLANGKLMDCCGITHSNKANLHNSRWAPIAQNFDLAKLAKLALCSYRAPRHLGTLPSPPF